MGSVVGIVDPRSRSRMDRLFSRKICQLLVASLRLGSPAKYSAPLARIGISKPQSYRVGPLVVRPESSSRCFSQAARLLLESLPFSIALPGLRLALNSKCTAMSTAVSLPFHSLECESEYGGRSCRVKMKNPVSYRAKLGNCTRSPAGTGSTGCPALRQAFRPPWITTASSPRSRRARATRRLVASLSQVQ